MGGGRLCRSSSQGEGADGSADVDEAVAQYTRCIDEEAAAYREFLLARLVATPSGGVSSRGLDDELDSPAPSAQFEAAVDGDGDTFMSAMGAGGMA